MGRRISALDGIRGLAALAVLAYHIVEQRPGIHLPLGPMGVDVFFALSGFLIGGILMDTAGTAGWWQRFLLRRTLRIWPLYFAVLVIVTLVSAPRADGWMSWLFLENYRIIRHPNETRNLFGIAWSLAVEEHAYLILPFVIRWIPRHRLPWILCGFVALSTAIRAISADLLVGSATYIATPCRIDAILVGVLAAWIQREKPLWVPLLGSSSLVLWGMIFGTFITHGYASVLISRAQLSFPVAAYATATMLPAIVFERMSFASRWLSLPPLRAIGIISFGVYMFHMLIIQLVGPKPLPVLATTIALAAVSWRWFEQPILSLTALLLRTFQKSAKDSNHPTQSMNPDNTPERA